nr:hypothetical protein [Sulfurimonas sp. SAG-AH-194-I05]
MKKVIKFILFIEVAILLTYFISFSFYINMQVAFLSSFFVIMASTFAYRKMVVNQVEAKAVDGKRDLLDAIEDPHELYDDTQINNAPAEELDLKEIVKEEKAKIKTLSMSSVKYGAVGSASFVRLVAYLFLVMGFIALKNNNVLEIAIYLPALLVGIIAGYTSSKEVFKK